MIKIVKKLFRIIRAEGLEGVCCRIKKYKSPIGSSESKTYKKWVAKYDTLNDKSRKKLNDSLIFFSKTPLISIVMPTYNTAADYLIDTIESVRKQIYPKWELCIADDGSTCEDTKLILENYARIDSRIKVIFRKENGHISQASNTALTMANGEWVAFLDHDDLLSEHALFWIVDKINSHSNARMIYSDEDKIDGYGVRVLPFFKPDWSPHLMFSQAYLGHLICYERELLDLVGLFDIDINGAQDYGLAMKCSAYIEANQIQHIPRILYHWRIHPNSTSQNAESKPYANEAGREALNRHIKKIYPSLDVRAINGEDMFTYRVLFTPNAELKVSIIIPTRDGLNLLKPCIESIINKSTWHNFEIVILDNGSEKPETIEYLRTLRRINPCVHVVEVPIPFNWSKLNNIGVQYASGDVFIFLNNDTQVITPSWIESIAGYAMLPEVGTVGALLLFDDLTIQHSGVIVGMGGWADHIFRTMPAKHSGGGPFVSPTLTRNVLAVTGACLAISRQKFNLLGGFDESFIVCGSDVELGLRAHRIGLFNVFCAEARLFHYESKTRSPFVPTEDFIQSDIKYAPYRNDKTDPYFNPNLSLKNTNPSLDLEQFL